MTSGDWLKSRDWLMAWLPSPAANGDVAKDNALEGLEQLGRWEAEIEDRLIPVFVAAAVLAGADHDEIHQAVNRGRLSVAPWWPEGPSEVP